MTSIINSKVAREILTGQINILTKLGLITSQESTRAIEVLNTGPDRLLTKSQAAEKLNLSVPSIENYVREGSLKAYKVNGKTIRFKLEDVNALLEPVKGGAEG